MVKIRPSKQDDRPALFEIWRSAVRATHHFLAEPDFQAIAVLMAEHYLANTQLWVVVDEQDRPLGFMGMSGSHIDSLFIHSTHRGKGLGTMMFDHAKRISKVLTVDVNEQNEQATEFYRRMGFIDTGHSDFDDEGRPYPLLHMRLLQDDQVI
ncbi:acetyltransferase [Geminicoccus flavidas]|uniref:acetyltransferase n=1 Tax=Geminicoccus flavidas TaxID=2506407 RepID=UPI00135A1E9F|nr:acetyltransferase [Geminicoccus flavidas]